ncbi:FAD-dependent oxidoreductase [Ottowia beijingensis]|uniref:FAD-dependent oxidoreductase n=1 Tax=Ottowia beijingensis TaxID=1207057 RepID=A0A853IZH5_9BURK|nr:FAD-dependent oxidoreductase [Ottowia beijingensis]NZA03356.1 FAD-dependent oxidoreductase [Ottowia beijingensis]
MSKALHMGIAGAGLLGRLLAWQLSRAGHRVSVFDPSSSAQPVARSQAPDPYVPTAAAFTAAGMLSPLSELDNAEPAVAALGWRSIALWRQIAAQLGRPELVRAEGSLMLAHRADLGAAQRVLDRLKAATATPEWQAASPREGVQPLDLAALRALEPSVQGPAHAWLLPGEGRSTPWPRWRRCTMARRMSIGIGAPACSPLMGARAAARCAWPMGAYWPSMW